MLAAFGVAAAGSIRLVRSERAVARAVGWLCLAVVLAAGWAHVRGHARRERELVRYGELLDVPLGEIDEASGATLVGDRAYVVDDDDRRLFALEYDPRRDAYNLVDRVIVWNPRDSDPVWERTLDVDDLEGAASRDGFLYVTTSFSNRRDGTEYANRQWLLELLLHDDGTAEVRRSVNLRPVLERILRDEVGTATQGSPLADRAWRSRQEILEVMNVEGLAIDDAGNVYLGFRSPMVAGEYALALRSHLDRIFERPDSFELFALDLRVGGDLRNAIVGMEYDPVTGMVLVLSNSQYREEYHTPVLWIWDAKRADSERIARPHPCHHFGGIEAPTMLLPGKPEALLVPPLERSRWLGRPARDGRIHLFYDVDDGRGLQRSFRRSELCPDLLP